MDAPNGDLESDEARRRLYALMAQDLDFHTKATRALELGKAYLGVENGHLTRVDAVTDFWETIESTDSPEGSFPPGLTLDLQSTYCRRTIEADSPVAVNDAPNQGWEDDPAYEAHDLDCYHGVTVLVDDHIYGTVCFVSESARADCFTADESMYAELISRLLGHAIERERQSRILTEREEMIDVLCRVLRHNLRNELTVVRGHAEHIQNSLPDNPDEHIDVILRRIDEVTELGDKTRQLSRLVEAPFEQVEYDLEQLITEIATQIDAEYPDASITIEGTVETPVQAAPEIETALEELLDNAVRHSGESPHVTVSLSRTQETIHIQVADDGCGMPANEQAVLQEGTETPLRHGSGLGLWVIYWVIDHHDGDIDVTVTDAGSSVTVSLPRGPSKIPVSNPGDS